MSDQLDQLFDELRGQRPPAPFAPAEAVRRRGQQRARHQVVSAGVAVVAVLAVVGLGAGTLATTATGRPDQLTPAGPSAPSTPSSSSTSPTSPTSPTVPAGPLPGSGIPREWLLSADDFPNDSGWEPTTNEMLESEWFWGTLCGEYVPAALPDRLALDTVSWRTDEPPQPVRVDQLVEHFTGDGAVAHLADVREVVGLCFRGPTPDGEVAPVYLEITDAGLAGDESLLIVEEQYYFEDDEDELAPEPHARFVAVVRVGDVVTTLVSGDEGFLRTIARHAADRLR